MKNARQKKLLVAVALGALMSLQTAGASADDTAKEIRYLKERLKELEAKVARQAHENKQTEAQVHNIAKFPPMPPGEPPVVCKDQPCPPPPPPVFVSFTNGLKVESWDKAFSFKIGGRILVDGGVNSEPVQAFVGDTALFPRPCREWIFQPSGFPSGPSASRRQSVQGLGLQVSV